MVWIFKSMGLIALNIYGNSCSYLLNIHERTTLYIRISFARTLKHNKSEEHNHSPIMSVLSHPPINSSDISWSVCAFIDLFKLLLWYWLFAACIIVLTLIYLWLWNEPKEVQMILKNTRWCIETPIYNWCQQQNHKLFNTILLYKPNCPLCLAINNQ